MVISDDISSYGFIAIAAPGKMTINGGEYRGDTDDGSFIVIVNEKYYEIGDYDASNSTVTLNNVIVNE